MKRTIMHTNTRSWEMTALSALLGSVVATNNGCIGNPDAVRGIDDGGAAAPGKAGALQKASSSSWAGAASPNKTSTTQPGSVTLTTAVSQGGRSSMSSSTPQTTDAPPDATLVGISESGASQTTPVSTSFAGGGALILGGATSRQIVSGDATTGNQGGVIGGAPIALAGAAATVASGAGGGAEAPSTAPSPVCAPEDRQCVGNSLRRCSSTGQWDTPSPCAFVCDPEAARCTGVCLPDTKHCNSKTIETCSALGEWIPGQTCANICTSGGCTGSCSPGAQNCNDAVRQTCNLQGAWDDVEICPNVCKFSGGVAQCGGVCRPGTVKCLDNRTLQTCAADGSWGSASTCTYACVGDECGGSCVPGTQTCDGHVLRTCLPNGTLDSGTECSFVCQGSACAGVCRPPSVQCDRNTPQRCTIAGTWENAPACGSGQICRSGACEINTPYNLGQSTRLANANPASAGDYLFATPINVVRRAAVLKFGMVAGAAGANVKFGLYLDNNGLPGARVSQSDPVALASGNVEAPSAVAYTVNPGAYWIAAVYSANASDFNQQRVTGSRAYYAPHAYTQALPATFPAATALEGYQLNYYISVQDVP